MSYLRSKLRVDSDRRFYCQTDSYDVPGRLREMRSKHCYGLPRSVSFFQENVREARDKRFYKIMDEDEAFSKHMSTSWGSCALFGLRALTFLREVFLRVPQFVRVSSMNSKSDNDVELGMGRFSSKESLLARAAETISQTNLLTPQNHDEESIVITKSTSDNNLCDGVFRKFKMNIGSEESVQCVEVSLMYEKSFFDNLLAEKNDLKSIVLSEKCACVVWVWSEHTRIVVITESSNPNAWSLQQWYKKVLADMTLMDSRLIGHPYYWHPMVRRRLGRVVKRFKKLYRRIEELEAIKKGLPLSTVTLFDNSLRKGNRRRESQSFIEEIEEDSQCNDEFLMRDFVPDWTHSKSDRVLAKSKDDCGAIPFGDCYNKESDYHMNILDSDDSDGSSGFSEGENTPDYPDCFKNKIQRKSRTKDKYFCQDDIASHSKSPLGRNYQHCEHTSNGDDVFTNRRMSTEAFEVHESENPKPRHKNKRRIRRKGDHCIVPMENASDSQEVLV